MKQRVILVLLSFFVSIFVVGCGSSQGGNSAESNESNISKTSFLNGGTYGKLSYKIVEYNGSTDMPYLSGWRLNNVNSAETTPISSELPFTVYGGVQSSYGDSYQIYGNAALNTPVKLKYLLIPNLAITPLNKPVNFGIMVGVDGRAQCILQREDGSLYTAARVECERTPLVSSVVLTKPNQAVEIEIDLGEFDGDKDVLFAVVQKFPSTKLTNSTAVSFIDDLTASTILNVSSKEPSKLPPNVVASGDFLPSPDGFGFANYGALDSNALTNEDIAEVYGADAVCFNRDANNCSIGAYGLYLKQDMTKISGGGCYGMALASMMLKKGIPFKGKSKPSDYNPKATNTTSLNYSDVARLIAYKYNNQSTPELIARMKDCEKFTVKDTLKLISDGFINNDPIAAIGINISKTIGHAVTPFAISKITDDNYRIYVYDNNFPGDASRFIDANISTNSFYYKGSSNSSSEQLIYSNDVLPMCPIPLSMQQYNKINIQPQNSIQFDMEAKELFIINNSAERNYFNQESGDVALDIPDSTWINRFDLAPIITIGKVAKMDSLPLISSRDALERYINESYRVRYTPHDGNPTSIDVSSLTANYANAAMIRQDYAGDGNSSMRYVIHPSSRIAIANNPNNLILSLFMDDNAKRIGYIYTIKVTDLTPASDVSLGALITDSGELEVFIYDKTNFDKLSSTVNYTITASIQNIDGVYPMASKKVSQTVNSAIKFSYKKGDKVPLSHTKTPTKQLSLQPSLDLARVY